MLGIRHLTPLQIVIKVVVCGFTVIVKRSANACMILFCTAINADVANGNVGGRGRTCESNLVFSPAIGNVERQGCSTTYLYGRLKHGAFLAREFLNLHADGECGIAL